MYRQDILIDLFISIQHTSLCSSRPYLHNLGSCSVMLYSLILPVCHEYSGLYKVIQFAITRLFYRYNCKLLPRDYYSKTCQCPHNLCTLTFRYTLWWSVNLSDNWAFNVWIVNFIKKIKKKKLNKSTTINTDVNCYMVCLSGEVCVLWLTEAFTATNTPGDTANHDHLTPSYSVIADSALQLAFAATNGNFRSIWALKSIHISLLISLL